LDDAHHRQQPCGCESGPQARYQQNGQDDFGTAHKEGGRDVVLETRYIENKAVFGGGKSSPGARELGHWAQPFTTEMKSQSSCGS